MIVHKTIRKNQLTIKQLETIPADRHVYVPLGRAFIFINLDLLRGTRKKQLNKSMTQVKN